MSTALKINGPFARFTKSIVRAMLWLLCGVDCSLKFVRNVRVIGHGMSEDQHRERRRPGQAGQSPLSTLIQLPALVVLDRLPIAVLAIAHDGAILFANKAFAAMLGYCLEALNAVKFSQVFYRLPTDQSSPVSLVRSHGGELVELLHADGSTVRAWMSKSALLRSDDPVALVTFQDLTEQLWREQG